MRIIFALALTACSTAAAWRSVAELPRTTRASAPGGAVFLESTESFTARPNVYIESHHVLIQILDQAGMSFASQRIALGPRDSLLFLQARTVAGDGLASDLNSQDVVDESASLKKSGEYSQTARLKSFRFPNAAPGARLELAYAIEHSNTILQELQRPIAQAVPVEHYVGTITIERSMEFAAKSYNGAADAKLDKTDDLNRITLQMHDIEAAPEEWLAPPWRADQPWWAYRTRSAWRRVVLDSWAQMLSPIAHYLYDDARFAAKLTRPAWKAASVSERVSQAVQECFASTTFRGFNAGVNSAKGVALTLKEGKANNVDKTLLLFQLLSDNGVEAEFALTSRDRSLQFDPQFPMSSAYDHVLVIVPLQGDLATPLFIDPSCEACAVGQLPAWSQGRAAALIARPSNGTPPPLFVPIAANKPPPISSLSKVSDGDAVARR